MALKEINDVNKDGVDDSMQVKDQSKLGDHGAGKDVSNPELRKPGELNPPEEKRPPDEKEVPEIDPEDDEALQVKKPPDEPSEGDEGRGGFSENDDAIVIDGKERSSDTPPEQHFEEDVEKGKQGQPGTPPEETDKLRAEAEGKPKLPAEADLVSDETKTKEAGQPSLNPEDIEERDVKVVSGKGEGEAEPAKQEDALEQDDAAVIALPAESKESKETSTPAEIDPEDDAALAVEPKDESVGKDGGIRENADSDGVSVGSDSALIGDTAGVYEPDVKPKAVDAKDSDATETTEAPTVGASDQTRLHEAGVHADAKTEYQKDDSLRKTPLETITPASEQAKERQKYIPQVELKARVQEVTDKTDSSVQSHLEIAESYFGWSDYSAKSREIGKNDSLLKEEKVKAIQAVYARTEDKTDICAPSDAQYVKTFDPNTGDIIYDWLGNLGFTEGTEKAITRDRPLPDTWDRYGHMGGSNFSPIPESSPYTTDERSIPYINNQDAYHQGTINIDSYFDKIDAVKNNDYEKLNNILMSEGCVPLSKAEHSFICYKYEKSCEYLQKNVSSGIDVSYGLQGTAARWGNMNGGAEQITTPLSGELMKRLGILREEISHE